MNPKKATVILLVLGVLLEGLFLGLGYGLSTHIRDIVPFVGLCLGAFSVYAFALVLVPRIQPNRWTLSIILLFSLIFRATLVPVKGDPFLPDADIYRYLWDGKVTSSGLNPYRYSPGDVDDFKEKKNLENLGEEDLANLEKLARLSREPPFQGYFPSIRYRKVKTIYPPLAQYLFAAAAWIRPGGFVCLKLFLFGFEALTLLFITLSLRKLEKCPLWVMVYGWCPLVVEEFAYSGHHDAAAVSLLAGACFFVLRGRFAASGGLLGLAISSKIFPAVLLPLFLRRAGWRSVLTALAVVVLLALPFLGAGRDLFSGLGAFAREWKFNAGIFSLLDGVLPSWLARLSAGAMVAALSFWYLFRGKGTVERGLREMLMVLLLLLLVSPVLNPWYVTWIVPFLCFFPFPPLILLTGCVFLHYFYFYFVHYLKTPLPGWLRPLEYGIFYLALALGILFILHGRRKKDLRDHPGPQRGEGHPPGDRGDPPECGP
jgi:hypothetical protein